MRCGVWGSSAEVQLSVSSLCAAVSLRKYDAFNRTIASVGYTCNRPLDETNPGFSQDGKASEKPKALRVFSECSKIDPSLPHSHVIPQTRLPVSSF